MEPVSADNRIQILKELGYTDSSVRLEIKGLTAAQILEARKNTQRYLKSKGMEAQFVEKEDEYLVFSRQA